MSRNKYTKDGIRTRAYDKAMQALARKRSVNLDVGIGKISVVVGPNQGPNDTVGNKGWGFIEYLTRWEGWFVERIDLEELLKRNQERKGKPKSRK